MAPQEKWEESKQQPFFLALEAEVVKAQCTGKSVIIQIDSNSKLGPEIIPNDPHKMSPNGKQLARIIDNHALIVANSYNKCTGLITRRRVTTHRIEESCIDVVLFSSDLQQHFTSMVIDEKRKHVLTKISKTKKGIIKKESDHHILISEFNNIVAKDTRKEKVEMFNIKNVECQKKFRDYTTNTQMLSSIFNSEDDLDILSQRTLEL